MAIVEVEADAVNHLMGLREYYTSRGLKTSIPSMQPIRSFEKRAMAAADDTRLATPASHSRSR